MSDFIEGAKDIGKKAGKGFLDVATGGIPKFIFNKVTGGNGIGGLTTDRFDALVKSLGYGAAIWAVRQLGLGDDPKAEKPEQVPTAPTVDPRIQDAKEDTMAALDDAADDILDDDGSDLDNKTDDATATKEEEKKDGS